MAGRRTRKAISDSGIPAYKRSVTASKRSTGPFVAVTRSWTKVTGKSKAQSIRVYLSLLAMPRRT